MKVKKYRASSMAEAMKQIRTELGNDAVILNSKVIQTGGFLGFFKKRSIEVIAALDSYKTENIKSTSPEKQRQTITYETIQPKIEVPNNNKDFTSEGQLQREVAELKALIKKSGQLSNTIPLPEPIQKLKQRLLTLEVDQLIISDVIKNVIESWYSSGGMHSDEIVFSWARQYLIDQISDLPFGGTHFKKKYINIVGPTGVGKTTTLAKIAAECILKHKKKVAFITTDTYRIAAIDQLKTYANILNVPIEICYNIADFQQATEKFNDYDIVFIDTAGRNFRNSKYVEDLTKIIDFQQEIETFLVLSLTSKQVDMEEIYKQFSLISIDKLIFSKADETATFGAMYNLIHTYKKAVAYITNGQNVPDDFLEASPDKVVERIIGAE